MLIQDMNLDEINGDTLDSQLETFNGNVLKSLDIHAPIKKCKVTERDH